MEFAGRVAVVTGAAGGIGAAVVRALADAGATVAALDLHKPGLVEVERVAAGRGLPVTGFVTDVSDRAQVRSTVVDVERQLGPVDLLVNGAGVLRAAPTLDLTERDWSETLAVNVGGVVNVSSEVAARMVGRGRGAIVTIASNAAGVPRMQMGAYGAAKAAAVAFTKNLGLELAGAGVRCNVVAPGSTDTPMLRSLWRDESGPTNSLAGVLAEYRVGIPLGRFADPSDVADAVLFLLSDRARHITMHDLYVDGGAALGR
ncbi:2,3-dihydro-2,3-dihydroxybenzoate dehydrogenase [Micromonospora sp. WMMD882]|uniref:2,3-dihydro-2,3-dihydroxybenzoate dehydrogenase n=1 Tax=Micromonospora sp. WMMD882 TaxID=3015151 RepID=UPI00248CA9B7|nr:2,3-dihydro-2,3-dihydroxybenzoate dehydrogenase [Micromonospora sp. WMMD882]WBB81905.1 2,3-dihydro-2,3-dihydroxybenzoate dehydrogenase [Micromonospora sp. WMMD882]